MSHVITEIMGDKDDLIYEAERIMHVEHEANGFSDYGTCVLGAGIMIDGQLEIRQVTQGNMSAYDAAKPAIEFLRNHGFDAKWHDGRMD